MGDAWFQAVRNLAGKDLRGNPLNGITGTSQVTDPDGYASSWVLVIRDQVQRARYYLAQRAYEEQRVVLED
jgi:hypothetical protein